MRIPRWLPKPVGSRWHARNDRAIIEEERHNRLYYAYVRVRARLE